MPAQGLHQVHAVERHRRAARSHRRLDVQGGGRPLAPRADRRHLRRQAGALQRLPGPARRRRRGGDSDPYWVSYPEMVRLAGGKPVDLMLRQEEGWAPRPEDLEKLLTPRTKVFMYSSPSNPTGGVWSEQAMRGIAAVLEKYPRVVILSDDIYDRLVYGGKEGDQHPAGGAAAERADGTGERLLQGVRDDRPAPRLGVRAGRHHLRDEQGAGRQHLEPELALQHAAVAALRGPQEPVEAMRVQFEKRRCLMVELLTQVKGVDAHAPDGAYYVFANFSGLLNRKYRGEPVANTERLAELCSRSSASPPCPAAPSAARVSCGSRLPSPRRTSARRWNGSAAAPPPGIDRESVLRKRGSTDSSRRPT